MGEGRSHWSSMVLRKSQTCFSDRHTHPNSMYLNFCHVLNLDNKHQKRNRDFNALLYFLKNRMNERTIRQELFFNGIIEKQELDEYTSLALHSYRQVINWLKKKATNEIQIRAGI